MRTWKIGERIIITVDEHEGKKGFITGIESVTLWRKTFDVPVITLDDGTVVKGYECWWEPVL